MRSALNDNAGLILNNISWKKGNRGGLTK